MPKYVYYLFQLYIDNRLQIGFSNILKVFLQSGLILIALLCGLDRVLDNKHHPSDVIAGFILGAAVAILVVMFYITSKVYNILLP